MTTRNYELSELSKNEFGDIIISQNCKHFLSAKNILLERPLIY